MDGIHIPGPFFRAAVRAKGAERSVLVTDAVMPAMCQPGLYRLGQVDVELRSDGSVVLRGETRLAGSSLRMDRAIGNAVRLGGISLREALAMSTMNPARVARMPDDSAAWFQARKPTWSASIGMQRVFLSRFWKRLWRVRRSTTRKDFGTVSLAARPQAPRRHP